MRRYFNRLVRLLLLLALLANTYRQMGRTKEAEEETRTYQKLIGDKERALEQLKAKEQGMATASPPAPNN